MLTEEQFSYLAKKYMDMVFRLALHYTKSRSESDDITQEVLLKLYRADKAFESEDHVRYWLIRVTVNECKRAFLSPWKRTEPIEDYAEQLAFKTPEHSELFHAVMALPQKYRVPLFLHYYEGGDLPIPRHSQRDRPHPIAARAGTAQNQSSGGEQRCLTKTYIRRRSPRFTPPKTQFRR